MGDIEQEREFLQRRADAASGRRMVRIAEAQLSSRVQEVDGESWAASMLIGPLDLIDRPLTMLTSNMIDAAKARLTEASGGSYVPEMEIENDFLLSQLLPDTDAQP